MILHRTGRAVTFGNLPRIRRRPRLGTAPLLGDEFGGRPQRYMDRVQRQVAEKRLLTVGGDERRRLPGDRPGVVRIVLRPSRRSDVD